MNQGIKEKIKELMIDVEKDILWRTRFLCEEYVRTIPYETFGDEYDEDIRHYDMTDTVNEAINIILFESVYHRLAFHFAFDDNKKVRLERDATPIALDTNVSYLCIDDEKSKTNAFFIAHNYHILDLNEYREIPDAPNQIQEMDVKLIHNIIACHNEQEIVTKIIFYPHKDWTKEDEELSIRLTSSKIKQVLALYGVDINIKCLTYKDFLLEFYPESIVDFALSKIINLQEKYADYASMNNVGTFLYDHKDILLNKYMSASNNYVGTQYIVEDIDDIDECYRNILRKMEKNPPYQTENLLPLFKDLQYKSTENIKLIKNSNACSSLLSSEWLFANLKGFRFLDNTFVCAGYLKTIEILLSEILLRDYSNEWLTARSGSFKICKENEHMLMLRNMFDFMLYDKKSASKEICQKYKVRAIVDAWIHDIRNGYFHKDILEEDCIIQIRNKTMELIYIIIGTLPRQ